MQAHLSHDPVPVAFRQLQRHLKHRDELISITHYLDQHDIDYRILKGVPLNQLIYGIQVKRHSCDIDVLIHLKDFLTLHHYLIEQGYTLQHPHTLCDLLHHQQFLMNYVDEVLYWHAKKAIAIDLKWKLYSGHRTHLDQQAFESFQMVFIHHNPIKVLSAPQNYYYLCLHGAKHLWSKSQWLEDLASLITNVTSEWAQVILLAQSTYSLRALQEANILLQHHFQIPPLKVPCRFSDRLIIKLRFYFIHARWFKQLSAHARLKVYLSMTLNLLLHASFQQKKYDLTRLFVIQVASLKNVRHFQCPTACKMILYALYTRIRTITNATK